LTRNNQTKGPSNKIIITLEFKENLLKPNRETIPIRCRKSGVVKELHSSVTHSLPRFGGELLERRKSGMEEHRGKGVQVYWCQPLSKKTSLGGSSVMGKKVRKKKEKRRVQGSPSQRRRKKNGPVFLQFTSPAHKGMTRARGKKKRGLTVRGGFL